MKPNYFISLVVAITNCLVHDYRDMSKADLDIFQRAVFNPV